MKKCHVLDHLFKILKQIWSASSTFTLTCTSFLTKRTLQKKICG